MIGAGMRKNTRRQIKSVVKDIAVKRGRKLLLSEIKAKRQLRRMIAMELGEKFAEKVINTFMYGENPQVIIMPRHNGETAIKKAWNNEFR